MAYAPLDKFTDEQDVILYWSYRTNICNMFNRDFSKIKCS